MLAKEMCSKPLILMLVVWLGTSSVFSLSEAELTLLTGDEASDGGQPEGSVVPGEVHTNGNEMNFPDGELVQKPGTGHTAAEGKTQAEELDKLSEGSNVLDNDSGDQDSGGGDSGDGDRKKRSNNSHMPEAHIRRKRLALKDPNEHWPKGIVPFTYHSSMTDDFKKYVIAAQNHIQKYTCIKFVDYDGGSAKTKYKLDHDAHLIYKPGFSCSSVIGIWKRPQGQDVICCYTKVCVHENVHALGFLHEQSSDSADNWIRINYENIDKNRWTNFIKIHPDEAEADQYDYSSMMHYGAYEFSKNYKPVFTLLCGSPNFQFGGHTFYMFKQVSSLYKCGETGVCSGKTLSCVNQGFVSHIRGECKCQCPDGLDPASGCKDVVKTVTSSNFPKGSYGFLKSKAACPTGFSEGEVTLESSGGNSVSSPSHLDGTFSATSHNYHFCMKDSADSGEGDFEEGDYCIMKKGDCPSGFTSGSVTLAGKAGGANSNSGSLPDGEFGDNLRLDFCCRRDGATFAPIWLQNTDPIILFVAGQDCQMIDGMYVVQETFKFDNEDGGSFSMTGETPVIAENTKKKSYEFSTCYYTPQKRDCGGIIELSGSAVTSEFSTPGYPSTYDTGLECNWLIKGPADSHMVFDFEDFDIPITGSTCLDQLEIRKDYIGQPGLLYCGKGFSASIRTWTNEAMVVFRSDGDDNGGNGFKAKVTLKMKKDLCFSTVDKGSTYRGTKNYTNDFRQCLPWSQVTHCRHHAFHPDDLDDGLDENYCRNPGHGIEPWCYIAMEGCDRSCCDVCFEGQIHDNSPDCADMVSKDANFCKRGAVAVELCAKTCQQELGITPDSPKASDVSCSNPSSVSDASIGNTKSSFKVGEYVEYKCSSGSEVIKSFCQTDGQWSPVEYTCGGCSTGWDRFEEHCYKYVDDRVPYSEAESFCKGKGGIVATAKSKEELTFLGALERPMNPMWISLVSDGSGWKWADGDSLSFKQWHTGNPTAKKTNAIMLGAQHDFNWKAVSETSKYTFSCKVKPSERKECVDRIPNCLEKLAEAPNMCKDFQDHAEVNCPKTCGKCGTTSATCTVPGSLTNGAFITTGSVNLGDVVEFECDKNYLPNGRLGARTCLPSGELTGPTPECIDVSSMDLPVNNVEMIKRKKKGGSYRSWIGDAKDSTIKKNGKLIAWEFYSIKAGQVSLQVFRPDGGNKFKFIGQTVINTKAYHHEYHPLTDQISVQTGDKIGVWYAFKAGGVCYTACKDPYKGYKLKAVKHYSSYFKPDASLEFVVDSSCKLFSLNAIIA